ncbi:MAG: DUF3800 domain-containing protein [Nitrososphaerales archaeon]
MYLDESGDHSVEGVRIADWDKKHLCLFGCALNLDYSHKVFCPAFDALKLKYFGGDADDPAILHLEDIQARKPPFDVLKDRTTHNLFFTEFIELVKGTKFVCFAVLVDKLATQSKRYGPISAHAYHIAFLTMMERYCGFLKFFRNKGDVMAESRGGNEDLQLKAAYLSVFAGGTRFHNYEFFQSTLMSKQIKIKKKEANIAGLQLADMFALPARRRLLMAVNRGPEPKFLLTKLADTIEGKYNYRYGTREVSGYGKIFIL